MHPWPFRGESLGGLNELKSYDTRVQPIRFALKFILHCPLEWKLLAETSTVSGRSEKVPLIFFSCCCCCIFLRESRSTENLFDPRDKLSPLKTRCEGKLVCWYTQHQSLDESYQKWRIFAFALENVEHEILPWNRKPSSVQSSYMSLHFSSECRAHFNLEIILFELSVLTSDGVLQKIMIRLAVDNLFSGYSSPLDVFIALLTWYTDASGTQNY